jgi:predicted ArsR family transcriptional regulator
VKPLDLDGPRSRLTVERILAALCERPLSKHGIGDAVGIHPDYALAYMKALIKRGEVRIAGWAKERNNYPTPLYGLGGGPPARKPRRTESQRAKQYRAKLRKERPDEYMRRILMQRAKRMKPRRDIAASWIGGSQ